MRNRLSPALLVAATVLIAACAPSDPDTYGLDFSLPPGSTSDGAIVFFIDGVNTGIFNEMLESGELPAIRKYIIDRGLYCPRTVVNVPSVTLANEPSVVTGVFPGHHGITGINWFDRNRLIWRNYETIAQKNALAGDYTTPTVYELLGDRTTFSLFLQAHRGATKFIENWTSAGPMYYFGWYQWVDQLTLYRFHIVNEVARRRREFPALTFAYLLAPDFQAYHHGVHSPEYRDALRHTDLQVGRVCKDIERAGLLGKVHLALVCDHSLMDVRRHFPLDDFLEARGLPIADAQLWEQTPFEKRLDRYRRYPCVLYGSGDRYWAIQLRKPIPLGKGRFRFAAWPERPGAEDLRSYPVGKTHYDRESGELTLSAVEAAFHALRKGDAGNVDLVALLSEQEAVDAVAWRTEPDRVRLRTKTGEVEIAQPDGRGAKVTTKVIDGENPLARFGVPHLAEQIVAYFRAARAGDIAVFAAPGWDFGTKWQAGHGGLRPGDMLTPMAIAGPGVPAGRLDTARTVDLVPTILDLLGRAVPTHMDGRSLLEPAADAQNRNGQRALKPR